MIFTIGCHRAAFKAKWLYEKAPEKFSARFETSKGSFDITVTRDLSPKAADRFYQQVRHHYFDSLYFYRVVPGFVAQFGSIDTTVIHAWKAVTIPDEPVLSGNHKGHISYARGGPNSRGGDIFINLANNNRLDTISYNKVKGFPSFGEVSKGMETVNSLYSGYADATMKKGDSIYSNTKEFLQMFPKLDRIFKARILKKKE